MRPHEIERLAQVQAQIVAVERERDHPVTSCAATEIKRHDLLRLKGLGPALSSTLTREVYYRRFTNRRQVASYIGIAPSAYDSGDGERLVPSPVCDGPCMQHCGKPDRSCRI